MAGVVRPIKIVLDTIIAVIDIDIVLRANTLLQPWRFLLSAGAIFFQSQIPILIHGDQLRYSGEWIDITSSILTYWPHLGLVSVLTTPASATLIELPHPVQWSASLICEAKASLSQTQITHVMNVNDRIWRYRPNKPFYQHQYLNLTSYSNKQQSLQRWHHMLATSQFDNMASIWPPNKAVKDNEYLFIPITPVKS